MSPPASRPAEPERAALEKLALARARAELLEQVFHLPLKPELPLETWASRRSTMERELRFWIAALPRRGAARHYSDGLCEIDVCLAPEAIRERLTALNQKYRLTGNEALSESDLEAAAREWRILWNTASAAPTEIPKTAKPGGWENVTDAGVELARRAAAANAIQALLDQAGNLKVSNARRLREFLDSSDVVRESVWKAVSAAATVEVEFALDQVAVSEARLELSELIRILTETHQIRYQGEEFRTTDFREMALLAASGVLKANGLAVPPSRGLIHSPNEPDESDAPAWQNLLLETTGRYETDEENPEKEKIDVAARVELARLAAVDDLRQQAEMLVLPNGETVAALLAFRPDFENDLLVYLSGARIVRQAEPEADGSLEIRVELPLQRLWLLSRPIMQQMPERPPLETQPASQPTLPEAAASQPATQPASLPATQPQDEVKKGPVP